MIPDLKTSILESVAFLRKRQAPIPPALQVSLCKAGIFEAKHAAFVKAGAMGYDALRGDYWAHLYDSVEAYLSGDKPITLYRNSDVNLVTDFFQKAAEEGYQDAGAKLPLDEDTQAWLDSAIASESANLDLTFQSLKLMRGQDDTDAVSEAMRRADGYANTLDGIYNQARLYGLGNQMLTFAGDDGKESCDTCQMLKDQRHRASWFIAHNYVPPSGSGLQCAAGGHCQHYLEDDQGTQVTI